MPERTPSPAMIVGLIALCLGLGGSAIAAGELSKPQVKKIAKKQAKKQANKLITKRAPTLSVARSAEADHAATADQATEADHAASADSSAQANNAGALGGVGPNGYLQVRDDRVRTAETITANTDYDGTDNLVMLSNLAPGEWVVQAQVDIDNDVAGVEAVTCRLFRLQPSSVTAFATSEQTLGAEGGAAQQLTFPLTDTFTGDGVDDLAVRCTQLGTDNDAQRAVLIATLVNN